MESLVLLDYTDRLNIIRCHVNIPDHQKEVLEAMGVALLMLQAAEKIIRLCMTFVIQKSDSLTIDVLIEQEEAERKKTIGYFLSELRKRAEVHESFDGLLSDFLNNRNDFVHDLSRVENWDLRSVAGSKEARRFVDKLIWQTDQVIKVFSGLVMAWQEQTGISNTPIPDNEWFAEVGRAYKPSVDLLFNAKST